MDFLKNKKVLYIGQSFFGYELEIKSMLESMGAIVDYYNERPSNTFWTKVFIRINAKQLINSKIKAYYDEILSKIQNIQYDYVFIVKIETIDKQILERLKANQKNAKFFLYMWDSIKNYKGKEKLLSYFDKSFSFDSDDVKTYNELIFLPLFYIPIYEKIKTQKIIYDICFIGSGHSDRYKLISEIKKRSTELGLSFYSFFFLQSKNIFLFRKLFDKRMQNAKIDDFSFISLSQEETLDIISQSKVVVDIEHPGQVGLTMRTLEMLGCQKKLITTNKSVKNYDFYNENNILVVDRNNIKFNKTFFELPYQKLSKDIYEKYSLKSWIKTIFSEDQLNTRGTDDTNF